MLTDSKSSDTTTSSPTTTSASSTKKSSQTSSTWTPTPVVSVETITGQVRTVIITPTSQSTQSSQAEGISRKTSGSGLSTGAAVGLTVGLVALAALVAILIFFWLRRRKQAQMAQYNTVGRQDSVLVAGKPPSRSMSENSRYILGTDGRQVVEAWMPDNEPGSRRSRLMPVDPRLDPFAPVYQQGNKSRESVNTLRDDHDYSRRVHQQGPILRATNPDPDT
jgi:cell wall integrity and stress response component